MTVHHVKVQHRAAAFKGGFCIFGEAREVRGEYRRGQFNGHKRRPAPSCVTTPDYTRTRVHYRKRYTRRVSFNAELQPCFGGGMVFCEGGTTKCGSAKSRPFDLLADRKSTRLNSSHRTISYAVFCL